MRFRNLGIDWGAELLKVQNNNTLFSSCDLTLRCSDGYIKCHRELISIFRVNAFQENRLLSSFDNTAEVEMDVSVWNLQLVSKFVFILYFGEAVISKAESEEIQIILEIFQIKSTKQTRLPKRATRNSSSRLTELNERKILAVREINPGEYADTYIYGNGSEMEVSPLPDENFSNSENISYDENGVLSCGEKGLCCPPCNLIFTDSSDFLSHSLICEKNEPKFSSTPNATKIEPGPINPPEINDNNTPTQNNSDFDDGTNNKLQPDASGFGSIKVCLLCVQRCNDVTELIIHSHTTHGISPEKDYDLGALQCKHCESVTGSAHLPILLQHVSHCKNEKEKASRKRAISAPEKTRKRRRIQDLNEIMKQEPNVVDNTFLDAEESDSISSIVISKTMTLQLDANLPDENEINNVTQNATEAIKDSERNADTASNSGRHEASHKQTQSKIPIRSFKIPKLKLPERNETLLTDENKVVAPLINTSPTFTSTSDDKKYNSSDFVKGSKRNNKKVREASEKPIKVERDQCLSTQPLSTVTTLARATNIRKNMNFQSTTSAPTLNVSYNAVTDVQSRLIKLSNTDAGNPERSSAADIHSRLLTIRNANVTDLSVVNGVQSRSRIFNANTITVSKQRQPFGTSIDWTEKAPATRNFSPEKPRWSCRRCLKIFNDQKFYMNHPCQI